MLGREESLLSFSVYLWVVPMSVFPDLGRKG